MDLVGFHAQWFVHINTPITLDEDIVNQGVGSSSKSKNPFSGSKINDKMA